MKTHIKTVLYITHIFSIYIYTVCLMTTLGTRVHTTAHCKLGQAGHRQ